MKLLFTGSSSFTGFYFINELAKIDSLEIHAIISKKKSEYEGLKKIRLGLLNSKIIVHENIQFGDRSFVELLTSNNEKFDILCCHGAFVENYNSAEFDLIKAISSNTKNIALVMKKFKENNGSIIINTGSVFEPNEGICEKEPRAFNLYGLSKKFTYELFKYYCQINGISCGKFVIANPFGKFEEPRFTNYLFNCWQRNETPLVQTPKYIRDNIPVDLLAKSYADFLVKIIKKSKNGIISQEYQINPSGYVESQQVFTNKILNNINKIFQLDYKVDFFEQTKFDQPICRYNKTSLFDLYPKWDENKFWHDYITSYVTMPKFF
jgi:UDP-glucose 4-epimerase